MAESINRPPHCDDMKQLLDRVIGCDRAPFHADRLPAFVVPPGSRWHHAYGKGGDEGIEWHFYWRDREETNETIPAASGAPRAKQ